MKTGIIYLCKNIKNNKVYIGQTAQGLYKRRKSMNQLQELVDQIKHFI